MRGHTPGPWVVRDAPYGYDIFVSDLATDRALWIAGITTGLVGRIVPYYPSKEECEANARLIAQAPDLWKALQNPTDDYDRGYSDGAIAQAQADQWQPIETAPEDQEVLLAWQSVSAIPAGRVWEQEVNLARCTKGGWLHGQATHWQPLPTPPKKSAPVYEASHNSGEGDPSVMPDCAGADSPLPPSCGVVGDSI